MDSVTRFRIARAERAQGGEQPLGPVRRPYRHPVPGPDARVDQRAGHRGRPLVQLPEAEPGPARFRHRLRVAELPRRPGHGGRDRQLHRTSHPPLPPAASTL